MIKTKYLVFLIFTGNKVQLHDLLPNTSYVFNVRARNDVGYGNFISVPVTTSPPSKSASSTLFQRYIWYIALVFYYGVGAKLQATNHVPRPVDRGTATRYGG